MCDREVMTHASMLGFFFFLIIIIIKETMVNDYALCNERKHIDDAGKIWQGSGGWKASG